jgi:alcohol dehydrogenase, propanol-preferring
VRGLRFAEWGQPPVLTDLPVPEPGPGEVLIRVAGAGLCQSDLHVIDAQPGDLQFRLPFTLGHEVAGSVAALGPGVGDVAVGEMVAVYGPWGCGSCPRCAAGRENYCDRRAKIGAAGVGLGRDGGMADLLLVPAVRHLEPLRGVDPARAAPLTDAGVTSYHAISVCSSRLTAGSVAVVIGVGGLGHLAVQILRATTSARVVAVDVRPEALALADRCGAHHAFRMGADTARDVRAVSEGRGTDAVFDFVGSPSSLVLAASVLGADADLVVVGSGGGQLVVKKFGDLPAGCRVSLPFWGTRSDLTGVIDLARRGAVRAEIETFPLSAASDAIARMRDGTLNGRAVIVPDSSSPGTD